MCSSSSSSSSVRNVDLDPAILATPMLSSSSISPLTRCSKLPDIPRLFGLFNDSRLERMDADVIEVDVRDDCNEFGDCLGLR